MQTKLALAAFALLLVPVAAPAVARAAGGSDLEAAAAPVPKADDAWQLSAQPFLWAPSLDTRMSTTRVSTSAHASFSDLLDNLDMAAMLHVEARKGPWVIFLNGTWMDLSAEENGPAGGDIDVKMTETILEAAVGYRLVHARADAGSNAAGSAFSLEAYAGARYTRLDAKINPERFGSVSETLDWIDPIVGLRMRADVTPEFALIARGDVGGIGVDDQSSWFVLGGFEWRASEKVSVTFGWAVLAQHYETGGHHDFALRQTLSGPVAGVTFRF